MPAMCRIEANPAFKTEDPELKAAFVAAKKKGPIEMPYVVAMENVAASKGLYVIMPETTEASSAGPRELEDMSIDELKPMMLAAGIKPQKQMKKSEVIAAIRNAMDGMDIVED